MKMRWFLVVALALFLTGAGSLALWSKDGDSTSFLFGLVFLNLGTLFFLLAVVMRRRLGKNGE
ncbi:MAG: hypothetical protein D6757_02490 [Alphaproteobacteria bacterium]|nr:MAG: hypothetical protein D6757_02490 [Alphaproteobacteria bacterium]